MLAELKSSPAENINSKFSQIRVFAVMLRFASQIAIVRDVDDDEKD